MKKIYLAIILLFVASTAWSQRYRLDFDMWFNHTGDSDYRFYSNFSLLLNVNGVIQEYVVDGLDQYQQKGPIQKKDSLFIPAVDYTSLGYKLYASSQKHSILGWNSHSQCEQYPSTATTGRYYKFSLSDFYCFSFVSGITVNEFVFYADCRILSHNAGTSNLLPHDHRVTLTATAGFPGDVYRWEFYDIINSLWKPVPNHLKSGNKINVCAADLFGSQWEDYLGKTVTFRIDQSYTGEKVSNYMYLNVALNSPQIISVDTIPNKCFGESNGQLKITFDRPLRYNAADTLKGESMNLSIGNSISYVNIFRLAADNSFTTPAVLPKGTYTINLMSSKFPVDRNLPTYAEGPTHTRTVSFEGPSKVRFTDSRRNVYCHGGADGAITVSATGGTPPYDLHYNQDGSAYQSVAFSLPNQHVLGDLVPGTYTIFVKDANGCIMKNSMDQPEIKTHIITQPEPLEIDYRASFNPLAYGYTDGWVKVVLKGGTPYHDKSYTLRWTDSLGNVLTTVQNQFIGSGYQSELTNIGDGRYYLQVLDSAYLMAQADRRTGCLLVDSFKLVQPPMLIAEVSEYRYVSCNNYSDGELYAWAHGGIEIPTQRYHYQWFKDNSGSWQTIGQTDSIARNLPAGVYRVSVTDANVITRYSLPFTLVQPDVLEITTTATNVACNGDSSGRITAAIQGGTSPYRYEWNTGDTTLSVQSLVAGNYLLTTEDTRGCLAKKRTEVSERNPVTFNNVVLKSPTCIGMNDGAISFVLSGGQPTYTTAWLHGAVSPTLNSLVAGTYSITVTDSEGCQWNKTFELEEALPVPLDLGKDRTLCAGQAWVSDATVPTGTAYQWSGTNGFGASTPKVSLTEPATYYATAITAAGCIGKDTITIKTAPAAISAIFTSPTQGYVDESVVFVNISNPRPESVEWQVPSGAEVLDKTSDRLELKFKRAGVYEVGILSHVGECEKLSTQAVSIVENTQLPVASAEKLPFVIDFYVAPNPSSGFFTAYVKLREESNIRLRIVNIGTGMMVDDRRQNGLSSYTVSYSLSLASGTYALMLETGGEKRVFKMIIY